MIGPRILVSYHLTSVTHPNYRLALRLIADLKAAGADVIVNECRNSSDYIAQATYYQLQGCQWLIIVETPEFVRSIYAQSLMQGAMANQPQVEGVLRVTATPLQAQEEPPIWRTLPRFDASQDYPRALVGIMLAMGLARSASTNMGGVHLGAAPPPVDPPSAPPSSLMRPFVQSVSRRQWLAMLVATTMLLLVGSLLTHLVASAKGTVVHPTAAIIVIPRPTGTATAEATQGAFPPLPGKLVLDDPLTQQDASHWLEGSTNDWRCAFKDGTYHAEISQQNHRISCTSSVVLVSDFAFQAEMMFVKGDAGGLSFRANASDSQFYHFYLFANGQYKFYVRDNQRGTRTLSAGNVTINMYQPNLLGVVAQGDHIMLYINHVRISDVHDHTFNFGEIGVLAKDITTSTEVVFTNAKVWQL